MARRADLPLRCLLSVALAVVAPAQTAAPGPIPFATPDGSRFLLLPDPDMPLVHWAVATLVHDPPGFAGLSLCTARAALAGTWRSGSRDPARELQVLDELDAAYHAWFADRTEANMAAFARLAAVAQELGDPVAHDRVLATVPMFRPELIDRSPVLVYVTTTVPGAIEDTALRLLDRRERTALRDLQPRWGETLLERGARRAQDRDAALHAEVLALAMPDHPFLRELEPPSLTAPLRADALRTWQASQRPERTVHVLHGGFDAAAVRDVVARVFATTGLPPSDPPPPVTARPITSLRRSMVSGAATPTVALAFVLPRDVDRGAIELASHWLGAGVDSRLGQELPRRGRSGAVPRCTAPWPRTVDGSSLLLLEVADPAGVEGLAELVLQTARQVAATKPAAAALEPALARLQRQWCRTSNDPRRFVAAVAETAQLWPDQPPRVGAPDRADAAAMQQLLARILATQPVVVEARP